MTRALWRNGRRTLARFGLTAWVVALLGVGGTLVGRHVLAFSGPAGQGSIRLASALAALRAASRDPADARRFTALHVLGADCRCSRRIAEHLVARRAEPDTAEMVLLVGRDVPLEDRLRGAGFRVEETDDAQLEARFGLVAAPLLVIAAPDGTVRYAGGYSAEKQGGAPQDRQLLEEARAGRTKAPLPVLGCAIDRRARAAANPLGVP